VPDPAQDLLDLPLGGGLLFLREYLLCDGRDRHAGGLPQNEHEDVAPYLALSWSPNAFVEQEQ